MAKVEQAMSSAEDTLPKIESTYNKDEDARQLGSLDTVEQDQERSGSSKANSSSPGIKSSKRSVNRVRFSDTGPTQDASHLPIADGEAHLTFTAIKDNLYQNSRVGRSKGYQKEAMTCECPHANGACRPLHDDSHRLSLLDPDDLACGEDSDCINRLTQVECRIGDCSCGNHCKNQRYVVS